MKKKIKATVMEDKMKRRNFILTGILGTIAGFLGINPSPDPCKVWGQRTLQADASEFNQRRLYHLFKREWDKYGTEGALDRMQPSMRKFCEPIVRGPYWSKIAKGIRVEKA